MQSKLADGFYDLAISNVPFGDYSPFDPQFNNFKFPIHDYFFAGALEKVRPGGLVTCVVMPPICPWELAVTVKDFRVGTRRLHRHGVIANVEGVSFRTWYFTPQDIRQALGSRFRPLRLEGLSVLTPTADNKTFARHHPHLFRVLAALDDRLAQRPPFNAWGDFFILTMEFYL